MKRKSRLQTVRVVKTIVVRNLFSYEYDGSNPSLSTILILGVNPKIFCFEEEIIWLLLQINKEKIDGVRVIHTGLIMNVHRGYKASLIGGEYKDLGYEQQECIEMYDFNGNRFYSNCSSKEEAEKLVAKLKKEGKDAVGVYIVKQKEEKENEDQLDK